MTTPTQLETKWARVLKMMIAFRDASDDRHTVARLIAWLDTNDMQQVASPVENSQRHEAVIAVEALNFYLHNGRQPGELRSITESYGEFPG